MSLPKLAALVLVAGEDDEEAISHLLVDLQLGVPDVGPEDAAGVVLALEAPLEAALAEGMRAVSGDWVSDDTHAELALEQLLGEVHELLPGLELLGLDLAPEPLVHLVVVHGLQEVCWDLELGNWGLLLSLSFGLLSLFNFSPPLLPPRLLAAGSVLLLGDQGRLGPHLLGLSLLVVLRLPELPPAALLDPLLPLLGPGGRGGVVSPQQEPPDDEIFPFCGQYLTTL